jgi:hypothetical protein
MKNKVILVMGLLGLVGVGCAKNANTSASCGSSGLYSSVGECGAGCSMKTVNSSQGAVMCWAAPTSTPAKLNNDDSVALGVPVSTSNSHSM